MAGVDKVLVSTAAADVPAEKHTPIASTHQGGTEYCPPYLSNWVWEHHLVQHICLFIILNQVHLQEAWWALPRVSPPLPPPLHLVLAAECLCAAKEMDPFCFPNPRSEPTALHSSDQTIIIIGRVGAHLQNLT